MSERQYWLGFSLVKGIGPVRVQALLDQFGSLYNAWHAPLADLSLTLDQRTAKNLQDAREKLNLSAELARLDKLGIALLTWDDVDYPALLRQLKAINQAPPVLYLRGSLTDEDEWAVSIVGTRSVSAYGRQVTHKLAFELSGNRLTIVSGLARGADTIAHKAALEAGGRSIAVLPCGLDMVYPPENRQLASQIIQNGAIVSIFPLGTKPVKTNFTARNHVISGLSRGVLVTEAGSRSGALITANVALEQGRDVFAVPGNITAHNSDGTNQLIQDGAYPVTSSRNVLEALNLEMVTQYRQAREQLPPVTAEEQAVLDGLSQTPAHIDEIAQRCSLPVSTISGALVTLELKGIIRQVGVMTYVRT